MNRRVFLLTSAGSLLLAYPVLAAASHEDEVARALVGQGFEITSQRRTFLGRVRFTAVKGGTRREVVVDPSSGEVLRDYSQTSDSSKNAVRAGNKDGGGSGSEGSSGGGDGASGGGDSPSGDGEGASDGRGDGPSAGESSKEPSREKGGVKK
jgi:hypothetical protein